MAARSLGKVTSASTTVGERFTALESDPDAVYTVQGYSCQALQANTGVVYICVTATPNLSTMQGIIAVVPKPSADDGTSLPIYSQDNPLAIGTFNLSEMYVLPAVGNEGVLIGATRT
jgi:hypothetical protein